MTPYDAVLAGWGALALLMVVLWFIQWRRHDASIVDVGWTFGMGALAIFYALVIPPFSARQAVVGTLAAAWALRLTVFLLRDRILGKPEDGRYQTLRRDLGSRAQPWFFGFFQMQALAAVAFSLPFLAAMRNPATPWTPFDIAAVVVWAIAVTGESIADGQLARWRANPAHRGRTCRVGLWSWSRHPNYFFEWLHWWTYVLFAIGSPFVWIALFGPAAMLFLLFRVTGIPTTEARALASRGDDYRDYQRTTSVFVPLPPRAGR